MSKVTEVYSKIKQSSINICYKTCAYFAVKGLVYSKVFSFATEGAFGVLIVIIDSTHKQMNIYQVKLFLKTYKTFVIPYVPVFKVFLNLRLDVFYNRSLRKSCVRTGVRTCDPWIEVRYKQLRFWGNCYICYTTAKGFVRISAGYR